MSAEAYRNADRQGTSIDGMTRDEICQKFQSRILSLAHRIAERLPSGSELGREDLASCGAIGLLEAIERFDDSRNILFTTFAEYRIRGAMMDALRANDNFSRYRRQLSKDLLESTRKLTGKLGRPPEPKELADELGMDLNEYWHAVDRVMPVSVVSIDDSDSQNGEEEGRAFSEALKGSSGDEAYRLILREQTRDHLKDLISNLSEKKRNCILMYYGRDMSLAEIAGVYEVTPSRISQILSEARSDLRNRLQSNVTLDDLRKEGDE